MKFVVMLLSVAIVARCKPFDHRATKDAFREAALLIVQDCRRQEGGSDADVAALRAHALPTTREGLCTLQCLLNTGKVMQDGRLHREGAIALFAPGLQDDAAKIAQMKAMVALCDEEVGDGGGDGCENAKLIVECTAKHGFTFPNYLKD